MNKRIAAALIAIGGLSLAQQAFATGNGIFVRKYLGDGTTTTAPQSVPEGTIAFTAMTGPAPGSYRLGSSNILDFTLTASENVTVTGTPRLALTVDGGNSQSAASRYATYVSGSGTDTLVFRYVTTNGDFDTNGIAINGSNLELNGGTIRNSGGVNATLTLPALPVLSAVNIDTRPRIISVTPPANGQYALNGTLGFSFSFDRPVLLTRGANFVSMPIVIGSTQRILNNTTATGTSQSSYGFSYNVVDGDYDNDGISMGALSLGSGVTLTDSSSGLNANLTYTAPNTAGILVDAVTPTLIGVTTPTTGLYTAGQSIVFTATYNKPVTVTYTSTRPRIGLTIDGSNSNPKYADFTGTSGVPSTSLSFSYAVQNGDSDSNGLALTAASIDANGTTLRDGLNNNVPLGFTAPDLSQIRVDTTIPTITSVDAPANARYTPGSSNLNFTVNFSEPVTVTYSSAPFINLTIGSNTRRASLIADSGTRASSFVFRYTTVSADIDSDGIEYTSPVVNGNGAIFADDFAQAVASGGFTNASLSGITIFNPPAGCWRIITTAYASRFYVARLQMINASSVNVAVFNTSHSTDNNNGAFSSSARTSASLLGNPVGFSAGKAFDGPASLGGEEYFEAGTSTSPTDSPAGAFLGFAFSSMPTLSNMIVDVGGLSITLKAQSSTSANCKTSPGSASWTDRSATTTVSGEFTLPITP